MIEYKLIGRDNRPITINNLIETSKLIERMFTETDTNKLGAGLRKTYGVNEGAFYIYYRDKDTKILLPQEHEESIKERLEVVAELKFGEVKWG